MYIFFLCFGYLALIITIGAVARLFDIRRLKKLAELLNCQYVGDQRVPLFFRITDPSKYDIIKGTYKGRKLEIYGRNILAFYVGGAYMEITIDGKTVYSAVTNNYYKSIKNPQKIKDEIDKYILRSL